MTTLSAHSGATFEAGGTVPPRGEQLDGVAINDRRDLGPVRSGGGGPATPARPGRRRGARARGALARRRGDYVP